MRKFGLIGYPLSHSFSPRYFAEKFKKEGIEDAVYNLYPLEDISAFEALKNKNISGLNVTIPYKETIIPYLDEISPEAQEIGAVNTIRFNAGRTIGYNTDVYGFETSLIRFIDRNEVKRALILGTGGAAKAVAYVLRKLWIPFLYVSRSAGDLPYDGVDKIVLDDHQLIINTTPLGMAPKVDTCPNIPYQYLSGKHFSYDLVYNPEKTLFLNNSSKNGAATLNGLSMLELQAEKSWEIWNL